MAIAADAVRRPRTFIASAICSAMASRLPSRRSSAVSHTRLNAVTLSDIAVDTISARAKLACSSSGPKGIVSRSTKQYRATPGHVMVRGLSAITLSALGCTQDSVAASKSSGTSARETPPHHAFATNDALDTTPESPIATSKSSPVSFASASCEKSFSAWLYEVA